MAERRLVDFDPLTGVSVWHEYDEMTDETTIYSTQDVENKLGENRIEFNHGNFRDEKNEFWKAASIPVIVIEQWLKEGIDVHDKNDWPEVRKRLNSSDWRHLRVGNFTV